MSKADFLFLLSLSVIVPVAVGLVRLRKISSSYQPFLLYLSISLLSECVTYLFIKMYRNSAVPSNLFVLIECNILLFQFYYWRFRTTKKKVFFSLMAVCTAVWIIETLVRGNLTDFVTFFRFLYSFILVLLAVNEINFMIVRENQNLFKNARFLICIAFIIYFLYQILYEGALAVNGILLDSDSLARKGANEPPKEVIFAQSIITGFAYITAFTKIIYAVAILYIPAKTNFPWKVNATK